MNLGPSVVPQVFHSSSTHLAGGNFGYITGLAGSGASDSKGHNISDLTGIDDVLYAPPGGIKESGHDNGFRVNTNRLRCNGNDGCHGYRHYGPGGDPVYKVKGIIGSHHKNVNGKLDAATEPANSYRFLMAVKGLESADWQGHATIVNHNEYYALPAPIQLGCSAVWCHKGPRRTGATPEWYDEPVLCHLPR